MCFRNQFISPKSHNPFADIGKHYGFGLIIFFLTLFSLSACKDPDELGLEVLPYSDQLFVLSSDSATLVTRVVREDSLLSKGVSLHLLGSYDDPVFGRSDASFYSQIRLGFAADFGAPGDDLVPDSLILSLAYAGYYGDTTLTQTIHVNRLSEDIHTDSSYYTSTVFSIESPVNDLANGFTFSPKPNSTVSVLSESQSAQLRIPLSLVLADSILALDGQSTLSDNTNWIQYFKGLYIHTDPVIGSGNGAISYFDLNSPDTKLTLYFHNVTTGKDSLKYDFNISGGTSISHQEHDYYGATTDVGHQLMDSTFNDSLNYLQAMAGVKTKITFPYLNHFKDSGNIVVNKAELEIAIKNGTTNFYSAPSKLFLVYIDINGNSLFMIDYFEGTTYFGGNYTSATQTYKFNIARHLQKILDGTIQDNGLYLLVSGSVVQSNRLIIGSGKNPDYPMKLNLYYTRLD